MTMKITADNFDKYKLNIFMFCKVFKIFYDNGYRIFGGVLRDLIVPYHIYSENNKFTLENVKKVIDKVGYIYINDIDICLDVNYICNFTHLHDMMCGEFNISDFKIEITTNKSEAQVYHNYTMKVWSKLMEYNYENAIKVDIIHNFITRPDFDVNSLTLDIQRGFDINGGMDTIQYIISEDEAFKLKKTSYFKDNMATLRILTQKSIQKIFDNILNKKATLLPKTSTISLKDIKRYGNILEKNYNIENTGDIKFLYENSDNHQEHKEYFENHNLCCFCSYEVEFEDNEICVLMKCGHLTHYICLINCYSEICDEYNHSNSNVLKCPTDNTEIRLWLS